MRQLKQNAIELKKIKAIIGDGSVNDDECFMKIEEIICLFKEIEIDGGNRHDFQAIEIKKLPSLQSGQ